MSFFGPLHQRRFIVNTFIVDDNNILNELLYHIDIPDTGSSGKRRITKRIKNIHITAPSNHNLRHVGFLTYKRHEDDWRPV